MKKSIICKLNIAVELKEKSVAASTQSLTSSLVDAINASFVESIESLGLVPVTSVPRHISSKNGGYSLYSTFLLDEDIIKFKLLLDLRVSDHASKPDLKSRTAQRASLIEETFPEEASDANDILFVDSYIKKRNWGVQVYLGSNNEYASPITSIEDANRILKNKLNKLISDRMSETLDSFLSKYSSEVIEFVQDYINETDDVSVVSLQDGEWVDNDDQRTIRETRLSYIETGLDDGLFSSIREFDDLCNVLKLQNKYS